MIAAQHLIDPYVAGKNKLDSVNLRFPVALRPPDLRSCKTYAELHYRNLVETLKT